LPKATEPVVLVASSEFILKSSAVRRTLEQRLIDDLKFALRRENLNCSRVEKEAARLVVFGTKQNELAAIVCRSVFGVAYAAPALLLAAPTLQEIVESILQFSRQQLRPGKTFAIRAHRSISGSISRQDVERGAGSAVLGALKDKGVRVDLDDPDLTIHVDLVGSDAYVYYLKLVGPGGLPLSSQWKMLAVLDSGPLSILAALAMMRRGCVVEFLIPVSNLDSRLFSDSQLTLARRVGRLVTRPNYEAFVMDIDRLPQGKGAGLAGWKAFVRASAVKFAQENRFKGLVFGDISGNLSSFTNYPRLSSLPIFYPLLGLEAEDLSELSSLAGLDVSELLSDQSIGDGSNAPESEMKSFFEEIGLPSVREVQF